MLEQFTSFAIYTASAVFSILLLITLIAIGWLLVWKVFLSRFKFVRELVNGSTENVASPPSSGRRQPPRRRTTLPSGGAVPPPQESGDDIAQGQETAPQPITGTRSFTLAGQRRRARID
ncbi:small integral membrane protein 13-like [Varroa jacobsoni]|uniref:small integral membrane protein 13-like n=1 Tax=Varroa jacobsoni TaxID=62625 RepID=UPI000BF328B8|nr:small integral membrane protein 13-like [Varroa jacobsoni]XP_022703376.1 small integral membrane protein 13-like [Varroa jacobsoni]